ncbi:ATP-binding protein [Streptomyces sp. NPDC091219]|uniref:ATP-binding protein n=1 Tax=Streptomyces sp. NPDC091219 TaxID=3155193 RepID=UPI00344B4507
MDGHESRDLTQTPPTGLPQAQGGTSPPPLTVGGARESVRRILDAHYQAAGTSPAGTETDDALLITSELVTNAMRHGGGLTAFSAHVVHGELMLQITDLNPVSPQVTERGSTEPGGFGWALAGRLCRTLYVRPLPDGTGKTVVACLPL